MITNFSTSSIRTGVKRKRFWDQSAVANSYFSIASTTVGASGTANVTFSNIPQNYTHLQIRGIVRTDRSANINDYISVEFNSDTGTNYSAHKLIGTGSSPILSSANTTIAKAELIQVLGPSAASNLFGSFVIDILDYTNTDKYKTLRGIGGNDKNGSGEIWFSSQNWRSTSAISTIKVFSFNNSNLVQHSSIALYGVLA